MSHFVRNDVGAMIPPFGGERPPWLGGDAQTVRHFLRMDAPPPPPGQEVVLELDDGDKLLAAFHQAEGPSKGCIIAVHGLNGCMDAQHILWLVPQVLDTGFSLLRVNMRGAGPARQLARGTYNAARGDDLLAFVDAAARLDPGRPIFMMAHSLGGTAALNMALDFPRRAARLAGLVTIGAPLDLIATSRKFGKRRNWLYTRYMLNGLRNIVATAPDMDAVYVERAIQARSVREFDDLVTAPLSGYRDAEHYYGAASVHERMRDIRLPTLVLQASNDPWVPAAPCLAQPIPRRDDKDGAYDKDHKGVRVVVTRGGGHVGFHDSRLNWHIHATISWCKAMAALHGENRGDTPKDTAATTRSADAASPKATVAKAAAAE